MYRSAAAALATMAWCMSEEQRWNTVQRVASNILGMAFVKSLPVDDQIAHAAAEAFEKKAYTAAQVAATTTTGHRPLDETTKAYARC